MKQRTCIVLSTLAFGLRALALIAVLLMTVLQEPVKRLYSADPEVAAIHTVPWSSIIPALFWLILAGVILLVLLKRPGKGGTIALTIVSAVLCAVLGVLVFPAVSLLYTRALVQQGNVAYASYSALSNAMSLVLPFLSTPASILSLLALGGACGKSFRE